MPHSTLSSHFQTQYPLSPIHGFQLPHQQSILVDPSPTPTSLRPPSPDESLPHTHLWLSWDVTVHVCPMKSDHIFTFQLCSSSHWLPVARSGSPPSSLSSSFMPHLSTVLHTGSFILYVPFSSPKQICPSILCPPVAVTLLLLQSQMLRFIITDNSSPSVHTLTSCSVVPFHHSTESSLQRSPVVS